MHELHRLSVDEQALFKRRFSTSLCNLSQVEMYWSQSGRRIIARAVVTELSQRVLPPDAVLIGSYSHPFNVNDFLGDLDDVLAKLAHSSSADPIVCAGG